MVRLVFRPYTQLRRSICTSESLRTSTRVSPGFILATHRSPSFGSYDVRSRYPPFVSRQRAVFMPLTSHSSAKICLQRNAGSEGTEATNATATTDLNPAEREEGTRTSEDDDDVVRPHHRRGGEDVCATPATPETRTVLTRTRAKQKATTAPSSIA